MLKCEGGCQRHVKSYYVYPTGRIICYDCWCRAQNKRTVYNNQISQNYVQINQLKRLIHNIEEQLESIDSSNPLFQLYKKTQREYEAQLSDLLRIMSTCPNPKLDVTPRWIEETESSFFEKYEYPKINSSRQEKIFEQVKDKEQQLKLAEIEEAEKLAEIKKLKETNYPQYIDALLQEFPEVATPEEYLYAAKHSMNLDVLDECVDSLDCCKVIINRWGRQHSDLIYDTLSWMSCTHNQEIKLFIAQYSGDFPQDILIEMFETESTDSIKELLATNLAKRGVNIHDLL